jgi:hypothetical protein
LSLTKTLREKEMKKEITKKHLKRIKLEIQELLGMLSVQELTTNWRFIGNYQNLHQELIRV